MKAEPQAKGANRRFFTWIFAAGAVSLAAFYYYTFHVQGTNIFEATGERLLSIPSMVLSFKRLFFPIGVLFFLAAAGILWKKDFVNLHYHRIFQLLLGLCAVLILGFAFAHIFQKDELEHIHTAWKMREGARPYADFFQHHHPLLWYQSLPVVKFFGATLSTLFALRFIQFLFLLGILWGAYKTALLATGSRETGYLALLLLMTFKIFIETGVEVRPDVGQAFFCTFALYFFLKYQSEGREKYLVFSAMAAAVGFFYLQKALFFLFPLGAVFLYLIAAGRLRWRSAWVFSAAFLIPSGLFLLYHALTGQWKEYVLFNWIINFYKTPVTNSWIYYAKELVWNPFFIALLLPGLLYLPIRHRRIPLAVKISFFTGLVIFFIAFMNPRAWKQYYFPAFPFLAVYLAYMLNDCLAKMEGNKKLLVYLLLVFSAVPIFMEDFCYPGENKYLFDLVRAQRENTSEYAFDEDIRLNLFREDMHFFWYGTQRGKMYDAYLSTIEDEKNAWAVKERYDTFDLCLLIGRYRPLMVNQTPISDHQIGNCETETGKYEALGHGLYRRKQK